MIKYRWVWLFFCLMLTLRISIQTPDSPMPSSGQSRQSGTATIRELALLLHVALQRADFSPLRQHIPTKQVYDKLMQLSTAPVREELLLYLPNQIENDFQKDFSRVIQDGLVLEINWPETKVNNIVADAEQVHNVAIVPVKMQLLSHHSLPVTFNAIRLDGRYYFLGSLQILDKDLNTQRKYKR